MRRITAMSRHRDHLRGVAPSMHFYGMREDPAIPLRDRGLPGCGRLTGREQLVKAAGQLAQAECDHQDRAALVSLHMPVREPPGLAISISGCSARNAWSRGTLAGRRHDAHNGPVSCHCRDRGQGDQRHFLTGVQQVPRRPASEHAAGGLAWKFPGARRHRGLESAQPQAPPGGAAGAEQMRRSLPALRVPPSVVSRASTAPPRRLLARAWGSAQQPRGAWACSAHASSMASTNSHAASARPQRPLASAPGRPLRRSPGLCRGPLHYADHHGDLIVLVDSDPGMGVVWAPRERRNARCCSSSARVAPLAKACWTWRAFLSSGRTAITSAALNVPANAARLTRGRVAEPFG